MKKKPEISIIIPVYGVEKYIVKCIESIKQQTFTDFEVILVNDGTKDDSVAVAENGIAGDKRFIILNKENGGQGSARNLGLDKARGNYIAFIDSDDYVEPRFLQAMYEKVTEENADVCTCDVHYVDEQENIVRAFRNAPRTYKQENDYLMAKWYISNFMWDKLFKKHVFNGYRFDTSLRTNEDVYLLFEMIYEKRIVSVDEFLYNYLQRSAATSKGAPPSYIDDRIKIINKQLEFSKKTQGSEIDECYLKFVYLKHFFFNAIVTLSRYSKSYTDDIQKLVCNVDEKYYNVRQIVYLLSQDRRAGLSLLLFKVSPKLFRLFARFWFRNHAA